MENNKQQEILNLNDSEVSVLLQILKQQSESQLQLVSTLLLIILVIVSGKEKTFWVDHYKLLLLFIATKPKLGKRT